MKQRRLWPPILFVLLSAVLLVGCGGSTPESANEGGAAGVETITLERQPCFGFCPVYTLSIHGDGQVEYDGQANVQVEGQQAAAIDPAAVQALADAMLEAGYLDMNDAYMNQDVTDLPYVISSITFSDGTTKRIEHYHGDFSAPEALTDLEAMIDQTAGSAQWVGETQ